MGITQPTGNSLTELVFENRNKNYGAYVLRKNYDGSLVKSFMITMLVLLALIAVHRFFPQGNKKILIPILPKSDTTTMVIDKVVDPKIKPKVHEDTHPVSRTEGIPIVVDSLERMDTIHAPEPIVTNNNSGSTGDTSSGTPGFARGGVQPAIIDSVRDPSRGDVDIMPEFPGGEIKLIEYLSKNIRYPGIALSEEISGTVYLKFVVNKQGNVEGIIVLRKVGGGCTEEAVRVVGQMPQWKPGRMKDGHTVSVYYNLPVVYKIRR